MLIVNSLGTGIELLTDVGIGQNIVYHPDANDPAFYNTAWSLQLIRSVVLWLACMIAAVPLAHFYELPILIPVVLITALNFLFGGLTSISRALLWKRMQIAKLTLFEMINSIIGAMAYIFLAYLSPTIWALAVGGVFGFATTMIGSYFLLPDVKQKFQISPQYTSQILHFGKWIFISSILFFLSTNFDRLYLAKVIPLELLGVYGIARTFSEISGQVALRVGNNVLFPYIASHIHVPRAELRKQLGHLRAKSMLLGAVPFSLFAATADMAIRILYDERYQAAAWILPVLIIGSWFAIMTNVNETTLLGLGKPSYGSISNGSKFVFLLIGLPLGVRIYGLLGGVMVIALADLSRYIPILIGQRRERFSFGMQDLFGTLFVAALIGLWEWLRWASGFGTSFESLPLTWANL